MAGLSESSGDSAGGKCGVTYMEIFHQLLNAIVDVAIMLFEFMGVAVIVAAGIQGIWNYVRHDTLTRLKLAKGMVMALEFKLGSEILRTVIVRDLSEIAIVGAIIVLRAALTLLIHWEIKNEKAEVEAELPTSAKASEDSEKQ